MSSVDQESAPSPTGAEQQTAPPPVGLSLQEARDFIAVRGGLAQDAKELKRGTSAQVEAWQETASIAVESTELGQLQQTLQGELDKIELDLSRNPNAGSANTRDNQIAGVLKDALRVLGPEALPDDVEKARRLVEEEKQRKQRDDVSERAEQAVKLDPDEARESVDDAHEREKLLKDVVELSRGSVWGTSTFAPGIAARASERAQARGRRPMDSTRSGFTNWGDKSDGDARRDFRNQSVNPSKAIVTGENLAGQNLVEFRPRIVDITEPRTEEVPTQVKGKFFGSKTEIVQETRHVKVGERAISHKEVAGEKGSDEPSTIVIMDLPAINRTDEFGRAGVLKIAFDLPKSVAEKLQQEITADPNIVESVVKRIMADYGFDPDEAWTNKPKPAQ